MLQTLVTNLVTYLVTHRKCHPERSGVEGPASCRTATMSDVAIIWRPDTRGVFFPIRECPKNKVEKVACFFAFERAALRNRVTHAFHHDLTIKKPRSNTLFFPNPIKKASKSADFDSRTAGDFFKKYFTAKQSGSAQALPATAPPAP